MRTAPVAPLTSASISWWRKVGKRAAMSGEWWLVPAIVDAVGDTPVIAAGGIADGRGMAAALSLGGAGGWVGTRFLASEEISIHPEYQRRILAASENDTAYCESLFDGGWANAPHR